MIAWKKFESFYMHLIYSPSISAVYLKNPVYLKITHEVSTTDGVKEQIL